jgi:hypothetical protein
VTRIPELEQELVAAAGRLQSPRRVLRPAARAALAAAAVAVIAVLAVLGAADKDDAGRGRQPAGTARGAKLAIDGQAGVQFRLDGRVLTVRLLPYAPPVTQTRVSSERIRATCGAAFAQVGPEGDPRNAREQRTRFWPAGRRQQSFRFPGDISAEARWCRLEDPVAGHVAFVKFRGSNLSQAQKIEQTGNTWARLFAASGRRSCKLMTQPACERVTCERISGPIENCQPPSPQFFESFRDAKVKQIATNGRRAAAKFSNGEIVELFRVNRDAIGGVWWIDELGAKAGRGFFE